MKKNYLIFSLVVVLAGGAFLAGHFTVGPGISGTASNAGIIHGGASCAKVTRTDGTVEDLGCDHNFYMSEGMGFLRDELFTGTATTNLVNTMFLGNGTSWDADLSAHTNEIFGCGLSAASVTFTDWAVGTGNASASYEWTSTCSIIVNTTGINCSACSASTEFFAGNNFTQSATLSSGDKLNVTWYVWSA
jgi:hypothetical protein